MIDKVLLVNPKGVSKGMASNYLWVPMGVTSIASYLRAYNISVDIIDMCVGRQSEGIKRLLKKIKESRPDIIAFSAMTPTHENAVKTAKKLKELIYSNTGGSENEKHILDKKGLKGYNPIFVNGGPHVTFRAHDVLSKYVEEEGLFDYIIAGEGEYRLRRLIEALNAGEKKPNIHGVYYKGHNSDDENTSKYKRVSLDDLPFPAYDLLDMKSYIQASNSRAGFNALEMIVSRGCPYPCSFCSVDDKVVKNYPVEQVVNNIEELVKRYKDLGVDGVWFKDSTFTVKRDWVISFCEKIRSKKLNLKFAASTRVDNIDNELLEIMASAGFVHLFFGVESGSVRVMNTLNKYTSAEQSQEHNRKSKEAFQLCNKYKIKATGYFMVAIPGETIQDIKDSIILANELRKAHPQSAIFFRTYNPLPGSQMFDRMLNEGRIKGTDTHLAYHKVPSEYPYKYDAPGILSPNEMYRVGKLLIKKYDQNKIVQPDDLNKYVVLGLPPALNGKDTTNI